VPDFEFSYAYKNIKRQCYSVSSNSELFWIATDEMSFILAPG